MRERQHGGDDTEKRKSEFIERFAQIWVDWGASPLEGRIAGYLIVDDSTGVSAQQIANDLGISRGSVSTYTRNLVNAGFVRRIIRPAERTHYFTMALDVWQGFLTKEQRYLEHQQQLAHNTLPFLEPGSRAHTRITNMDNYMTWAAGLKLKERWLAHKKTLQDEHEAGESNDS